MTARLLGIDFSGNDSMWRASCRRSNVWVAEVELSGARPRLVRLDRVQDRYPDAASPFRALGDELARGGFGAAGIDAPVTLPIAHVPSDGPRALWELVAGLPRERGRAFPRGAALRDAVAAMTGELATPKPYRACERNWMRRGVNVRSTLWDGPRGGAAMTAACFELLAHAHRPAWPWAEGVDGLVAEVFPAGQLRTWGLPHELYDVSRDDRGGAENRSKIVAALDARIELASFRQVMLGSADAIDAVLCAFGAWAVRTGALESRPARVDGEGWIAVHA